MSKFIEKSAGVYITTEDIITATQEDIVFLKNQATLSPLHRARICAHCDNNNPIHEMLIAFTSDCVFMPHRHLLKSESYHLVEGHADIVIFKKNGDISKVIPFKKEECFFYRLSISHYHTIIIKSPYCVIHEVTNGPFDSSAIQYAPFAPSMQDTEAAKIYIESIRSLIDKNRESLYFACKGCIYG